MALTKITPQMFDTSATAHDLNVDNGTFVVDGSASRVGIGTASPATPLHTIGITTFDGDGASRAEITSSTANSVVSLDVGGFNGTPSVARDIRFLTNAAANAKTERMRISSAGHFIPAADSTYNIGANGTRFANAYFDNVYGTLATAAQTNITSLGTLTGLTMSGNLNLNDDVILRLGTSNEFQIYHTSSGNSIISETGSGNLFIDGNNIYLRKDTSSGEAFADFIADGAAKLYHNGSKKFETTANGISVTGTIDSTSTITAAAGSNSAALTSLGSIELLRSAGNPYIDFKTQSSEDYDCRIQQDTNGLKLITGGQGSTGTAVEIDSSKNTSFSGSVNLGATTDGSRRFKWYNDNYHALYYDNNLLGSSSADVITYYQNFVFRHQDATNAVIIGGSSGTISCGDITSTGTVTVSGLAKTGSGSFDINAGSTFLQIRSSNSFIVKNLSNNPWIDASDSGVGLYSGAQKKLDIISTGVTLTAGNFLPTTDNAHDLGSTSKRWRNVYTTDLHLSNEGSKNDVDGTSGDWTIQEGDENLYIINNKSGKKYKFALEEIE